MFSLKVNIISGESCTTGFPWDNYKKIFVVSDAFLVKIGICGILTDELSRRKVPYTIFDSVEPDPSLETVYAGIRAIDEYRPDMVVALGGGSVIDAAKAMILFSAKILAKETPLSFAVIPTTSGTGSEVTSYSVITDTKKKLKLPIVSDDLLPNFALLDPLLTVKCPPKLTAESGFDALTHVMEAYVSTHANDFTDALAEKVIKMVFENLIPVYEEGSNINARAHMHTASCIAGMCFNQAGLGLNHAMSHSLGGHFHIPHGNANALLMPHIIQYNARVCGERYLEIAKILKLPSSHIEEGVCSVIAAVKYLKTRLNLPDKITAFPIDTDEYKKAIPLMAANSLQDPCLAFNPIQPSVKDVEEIFQKLC